MPKSFTKHFTVALTITAISALYAQAIAQSRPAATRVCPERYRPAALCSDQSTGDVVLAEAPAGTYAFTNAHCWTSYTIMGDAFCFREGTNEIRPLETKPDISVATAK